MYYYSLSYFFIKKNHVNGGGHWWNLVQLSPALRHTELAWLPSKQFFWKGLCRPWKTDLTDKKDTPSDYFSASLQDNLSVILDSGQLPASPGFLTHSGCGCNTVSCTVIDRWIIRCQASELHVGCAGGFVCSQCGLALELLSIFSFTICWINPSNPLQSLPRLLLHPVHPVASEGVSWSLARHLHWSPRLHQLSPRL